ncbi:MAG: hypothetical protein AB1651_15805 [Pseudomonadota bacterium]
MPGMQILEIAIGLTLVYLLLASVCSVLREAIEAWLKTRAVDLEQGIRMLLADDDGSGLAKQLYEHPLIYGLFEGEYRPDALKLKNAGRADQRRRMPRGTNLPSYIPAPHFAQALLEVVARPTVSRGAQAFAAPLDTDGLRYAAALLDNASVRAILLSALDRAGGDLARVQAGIEAWFNAAMDRVSGWYRRRTQRIILLLSLVVTVAVNANTLTLIDHLSVDASLRKALIAQVEAASGADQAGARAALDRLAGMGLPLGWSEGWPGVAPHPRLTGGAAAGGWWSQLLQPLIGLLLTALAVSLGAPFWFDMLNKLISVRSTLKPKDAPRSDAAMPAPAVAAVPPLPQIAVFEPHEWAEGEPQRGVL